MKECEEIVFKFLTQTASNGRSVDCPAALYLTAPVSGSKLKPLKRSAAPQSEFAVKDAFFVDKVSTKHLHARTHSRACLHLSGSKFGLTNFCKSSVTSASPSFGRFAAAASASCVQIKSTDWIDFWREFTAKYWGDSTHRGTYPARGAELLRMHDSAGQNKL